MLVRNKKSSAKQNNLRKKILSLRKNFQIKNLRPNKKFLAKDFFREIFTHIQKQ